MLIGLSVISCRGLRVELGNDAPTFPIVDSICFTSLSTFEEPEFSPGLGLGVGAAPFGTTLERVFFTVATTVILLTTCSTGFTALFTTPFAAPTPSI